MSFFYVPVAAEGGYVADGYCVLCERRLTRRRKQHDFEHHLGPDAAVLLDADVEPVTDPLDCCCEDCPDGFPDPERP